MAHGCVRDRQSASAGPGALNVQLHGPAGSRGLRGPIRATEFRGELEVIMASCPPSQGLSFLSLGKESQWGVLVGSPRDFKLRPRTEPRWALQDVQELPR